MLKRLIEASNNRLLKNSFFPLCTSVLSVVQLPLFVTQPPLTKRQALDRAEGFRLPMEASSQDWAIGS